MTQDIKARVNTILRHEFCNSDHEKYEACLDCENEAHAIIKELAIREERLVEALRFYANKENYDDNDAAYEFVKSEHGGCMYMDGGNKAKSILKELGIA